MKRTHLAIISIALAALLALTACSSQGVQSQQGGMTGPGMMGGGQGGMTGRQAAAGNLGSYQQPYPYGPGGMMGPGMMGGMMGGGMMGGSGTYNPQAKPITIDQAADSVRRYLNAYGEDLALTEVMEFALNFYAEVGEEETGTHAMELLIDKYTGQVSPEMGPNMMWNTRYGMMAQMMDSYYGAGLPTAAMPITAEQAKVLAQQFLDASLPGLTVADVDIFYGYYTLHTLRDGQMEGMLSVNGYTGAVWYHTWHGPFIGMREFE